MLHCIAAVRCLVVSNVLSDNKQVLPKSFGNSALPPSRQRMHSSASCAISCAMLTADESSHSAAGRVHPHRSATCVLYVVLCCPIPLPENAPSLTGVINLQSSHWMNRKMKISYNFAFWQAIIVYFCLCFNFQETISSESQWKYVSNNTLSVRKYCQLFTHESNAFLLNNAPVKRIG